MSNLRVAQEGEETEPSICIFSELNQDLLLWSVIKNSDTKISTEENLLLPSFTRNKGTLKVPTTAAVGSIVYIFLGSKTTWNTTTNTATIHDEVYSIDSNDPSGGWVEIDPVIPIPRRSVFSFSVNNKLYLIGQCNPWGFLGENPTTPAVYYPESKTWSKLNTPSPYAYLYTPRDMKRYAVVHHSNRVLLSDSLCSMYYYDCEENSYIAYDDNFQANYGFAVLDGILYGARDRNQEVDWRNPRSKREVDWRDSFDRSVILMGYDALDRNAHEPVRVVGLEDLFEKNEHEGVVMPWERSWYSRSMSLVGIGEHKLALVWEVVVRDASNKDRHKVYVVKMKMRKEVTPGGRLKLVAHSATFSAHEMVRGGRILNVFPLFSEPRRCQ